MLFDSENWEIRDPNLILKVRKAISDRKPNEDETKCGSGPRPKSNTNCTECELIKKTYGADQDSRNDFYSQLLNEELKLLQPCMRTRVYARILGFLANTKKYHTSEIELTDTEINNYFFFDLNAQTLK